MKNPTLPRPSTFLLLAALATLTLLVASCGRQVVEADSQSNPPTVVTAATAPSDHAALDSAHEAIDQLDSLLESINVDIDSAIDDLAADAASVAMAGN